MVQARAQTVPAAGSIQPESYPPGPHDLGRAAPGDLRVNGFEPGREGPPAAALAPFAPNLRHRSLQRTLTASDRKLGDWLSSLASSQPRIDVHTGEIHQETRQNKEGRE